MELRNPGDKAETLKAERKMKENTFPIRSRIGMTSDFFLRAVLETRRKWNNAMPSVLRQRESEGQSILSQVLREREAEGQSILGQVVKCGC